MTANLWLSKEAEKDKAVIILLNLAPVLMSVCPSLLKKDKLGDGLQTILAVGPQHLSWLLARSFISLHVQVPLNWSAVKNLVLLFHVDINKLHLIHFLSAVVDEDTLQDKWLK